MNDSKNLAMMFLLGAFLTGGVLGFTADRYMTRGRPASDDRPNAALTRIMAERLDLTAAQQKSIDSILDQRSRQYRAVVAPLRPKLDSIKMNAREQMRRVLSQEQKDQFEALIQEMNDSTRKRNEE